MRVDVFTIFPAAVDAFCSASLLGKARQTGVARPSLPRHPRAHHRRAPHGRRRPVRRRRRHADEGRADLRCRRGGRPGPPAAAARSRRSPVRSERRTELAEGEGFSLLCGRYEGVDHRVREHLVDGELSVGDVVLSGGESAACLVVDAVTRLLPGAMGNDASTVTESFGVRGLLEEPQYTRPATFRGWVVPDVLRQRQPRDDRALAPGPGAASHDRHPARPDRAARWSHRR